MLRFFKFGMGLGVYYVDLSYKLNLCSQYKVTPKVEDGKAALNGHGGECVGKTEIDSASIKEFGVAIATHLTLWERVTKDSIWKIITIKEASNMTGHGDLKLKNHDKNLNVVIWSSAWEIISYTYRF